MVSVIGRKLLRENEIWRLIDLGSELSLSAFFLIEHEWVFYLALSLKFFFINCEWQHNFPRDVQWSSQSLERYFKARRTLFPSLSPIKWKIFIVRATQQVYFFFKLKVLSDFFTRFWTSYEKWLMMDFYFGPCSMQFYATFMLPLNDVYLWIVIGMLLVQETLHFRGAQRGFFKLGFPPFYHHHYIHQLICILSCFGLLASSCCFIEFLTSYYLVLLTV